MSNPPNMMDELSPETRRILEGLRNLEKSGEVAGSPLKITPNVAPPPPPPPPPPPKPPQDNIEQPHVQKPQVPDAPAPQPPQPVVPDGSSAVPISPVGPRGDTTAAPAPAPTDATRRYTVTQALGANDGYDRYDKWLKQLADSQRYKLWANRHKGKIEEIPSEELFGLLIGEVDELKQALERGNQIEIMLEVGDIANFALAIYIRALKDAAAA